MTYTILNINFSLFTQSVLLYIDPGTGSIIIQGLIAAAVGIGIAMRLFWHSILKFLGIRKKSDAGPSEEEDKE
jgi:hypothetical protein